jgi:gluconolactonase
MAAITLVRHEATLLGEGLDHPESVCIDADGVLFAGGEAGQVYRIQTDGVHREIAQTNGFLLGLALDGNGRLHACDCKQRTVWLVDPNGEVTARSTGAPERPFSFPNFPVFDQNGNLYVSDSGDYWNELGDGCIMRIDAQGRTSVFHEGPFRFANGLAIDPSGKWLYIVQTTASNVVRIPLGEPNGPIEVAYELPRRTVPDGIAFAADGRLVIGCYKPDALFVGRLDGSVECLCEDATGELLNRPTNVALASGQLFVANLGGWHVTRLETDLLPRPLFRPRFE